MLSATISNFFTRFCLYLLFFRSFSYEYWETNYEHWAPNKPDIFILVEEKLQPSALEILHQEYGCNTMSCTRDQRKMRRGERWLRERREALNQQNGGQRSKARVLWRLSLSCSNDRKLVEYEKWQCLKDYDRRFGLSRNFCKIGAKTARKWSEGALHSYVSGHHRASPKWIKFAS